MKNELVGKNFGIQSIFVSIAPVSETVLYEPHRIAILLALADAPGLALPFSELARLLRYSDGNLVCHLRRLVAAGVVESRPNGGRGRASRTIYAVSVAGRERLAAVGRELAMTAHAIELALAQREPGELSGRDMGPGAVGLRGDPADEASRAVAAVLGMVEERFAGPD